MNCEKYLNLIDDLIEGELNEQDAGQVNSHFLVCPQCASYYRTLEQEKETYARYLFDVEPPTDLWIKFQAKVKTGAQPVSQIPETAAAAPVRKTNIFEFFRLYPALGFAVALIAFGIGLWKFMPGGNVGGNERLAKKESNNIQAISGQSGESSKGEARDLPAKDEIDRPLASAKAFKPVKESVSLKRRSNDRTANKLVAAGTPKTDRKIISGGVGNYSPVKPSPGKEQLRQLQLSALEKATTQQIEKIELLLRSFRNARVDEGGDFYDVGYEKQQARKLLERNVRLRQMAENYGTLYTEEILDRVEPLLLDIANLENNPLPEKVLDIKARVKNQNIIASLQIY